MIESLMPQPIPTCDNSNISRIYSSELEFIVVSADRQERILRVGVILPDKREQIDPEANGTLICAGAAGEED